MSNKKTAADIADPTWDEIFDHLSPTAKSRLKHKPAPGKWPLRAALLVLIAAVIACAAYYVN